jgi:hypothetical protein
MNVRNIRHSCIASFLGFLVLILGACSTSHQIDPPGSNSGSAQNASGTFLFNDPHVQTISVGQTASVYDTYSTITTNFTVTDEHISTTSANQNDNTDKVPEGFQFLILNVRIQNASDGDTASCPAGKCTGYYNPLTNFRLVDATNHEWTSSTGAAEKCSPLQTDPKAADVCSNRQWLAEATNGLRPGEIFTSQIAFLVPSDQTQFALFFAPYRFPDTPASGATATVSPTKVTTPTSSGRATLIKVMIGV